MIPFNKPPLTGNEVQYITEALKGNKISGDGPFGKRCQQWFEENLPTQKALLTPSCTAALELAAILIDVQSGDEIIMPSYTFVSTANAFVLRGAKIVFVDIRPDTMNIDETKIEAAITDRTKAIVPVHYAGVSCEMDAIMDIAGRYSLYVIEDAAQGVMSSYKERPLGTIGHLGAFSFHETKNYTSGGEGGLLIINDARFTERAEVIREKGTNRSQFFRGQVDKYTWVDIGSSYLPSEMQAAYLWAQLEKANEINDARLRTWKSYYDSFRKLIQEGFIELPIIPDYCIHNAHMFYIKVKNLQVRTELLEFLKNKNILGAFHYIPLHSTPVGKDWGRFSEDEVYTTSESERLLRLPIFFGIKDEEVSLVVKEVSNFFKEPHA
ncbi:dTDP-4-amino-4,6-dideoxygalactose transaminase [Idiomarina loihiensis]|uniref:Predicted pyridoxal phosphate-dependent enzyme n=1 Tax=Idiomarina loihiensis (strain ATCC BAA-735 / DSM 15497 / L2-TR) TaxID=283942 RepID=Q5QUW5_IDILO|nr:dTDP-4-amino-4,6-dideoxygalactose transaminase [Idiomarina loihiensis]AAV81386.1 Predicted pyridoxal phosphate-dependent enzyme [Idiomarina loihiensis L2TR]AGM35413.1 TDP-4-oxo-6-deoxy-D-glucose transaminase [Idiomarina loihiensis GSL 199]